MPVAASYRPDPRYPPIDGLADVVEPARFPEHLLRFRNDRWAAKVGLGTLSDEEWIDHFGRFEPLPENLERPLAQRYHGHQFRSYNPNIGDGRGFTFAQLRAADGRLLELGTKGSGQTPYSRTADGRLTLKGGFREILATEMLEALGVPTSKTFSLIETGEALERHDEPSPTRAGVMVRLSHSHIRFGSFQRHAYEQQVGRLRALLEHVCEVYYPDETAGAKDLPLALLEVVIERYAELAARWMAAGFVHGVLNTDNMNITGESFDYGPWRFLPRLELGFTAAYFDEGGLYAYGRQPEAVAWNLSRLAEALAPLSPNADWKGALEGYGPALSRSMALAFLRRLGLRSRDPDTDDATLGVVLAFLKDRPLGFQPFFFDWWGGEASAERALASPRARHYRDDAFTAVRDALAMHAPVDAARLSHRYFARQSPPDMRIEEVEELWRRAEAHDDWRPLEHKVRDLRTMGDVLAIRHEAGTGVAAKG